jgi:peptidoglycan hydrolase CwlO-like protein
MSEDPDKTAATARGAELRENVALTDARRTEEERAKAEKTAEKATQEAEKLEQKAAREREKAERLHAEAEATREGAPSQLSSPRPSPTPPAESPMQRPEVLAGAAFVGAFLVARILKRIFD